MIRFVKAIALRRVLFGWLLIGLTAGVLAIVSMFIIRMSDNHGEGSVNPFESSSEGVQRRLEVVLSGLVAHNLADATASARIEAATARLLPGWNDFELESIEVWTEGLTGMPGAVNESASSGHLRANRGWVDLKHGNLLLTGNIEADSNDGKTITANRVEYEAGRDEIRFQSAEVVSKGFQTRTPWLITSSDMTRLETRVDYPEKKKHPFFRRFEGGFE